MSYFYNNRYSEYQFEKDYNNYNYEPNSNTFQMFINKEERDKLTSELIKKLQKYNKDGFYHYAILENLINIVKTGKIYSRTNIKNKNFVDLAKINNQSYITLFHTKDLYKEFSRFYLNQHNPVRYKAREAVESVIILDYNVLYDEKLSMRITDNFICSENLKMEYASQRSGLRKILNYDFENIYAYYFTTDEEKKKRYAELLIKDEVSIKYIKKIVFKSNLAYLIFKKSVPNCTIPCEIDSNYF